MSNTIDLCAARAGPFTDITSGDRAGGFFFAFLFISIILTSATYGFVNKYAGFAPWNKPPPVSSNDNAPATDEPPPPYPMASSSMPTAKAEPEGASEDTKGGNVPFQRRVVLFTVGSIILGLNITALVLAAFTVQSVKYCAIEGPGDPPGVFARIAGAMWFLYGLIAMAVWCSVLWWAVLLRDLFGTTAKRRWRIHSDLGAYSLVIIAILPFSLLEILLSGIMRGLSIVWKRPPERRQLIRGEASDTKDKYTKLGNEGAEEVAQPEMVTPLLSRPGLSGSSPDIACLEDARGHADREEGSRSADGRNTAPITPREHLRDLLSTMTDLEYNFTKLIPLYVASSCVELLRKRLGLSAFWGGIISYSILYYFTLFIMRRILSIVYHYFPSLRRTNSNHQPPNDPVPVLVPHDRKTTLLGANIVFSILELSFARLSLSYARKHLMAEIREPWTKEWSKDHIPYWGIYIAVLSLAIYGGIAVFELNPRLYPLRVMFLLCATMLTFLWPVLTVVLTGNAVYFLPYGGGLLGGGGGGDRDAYWYGTFSACAALMAYCASVSTVKYLFGPTPPMRDKSIFN